VKRFGCIIGALGLLVSVSTVHAQSLEEQLRTQLREARSQLQDVQSQQAQMQSQKVAAEQERDQARKALEQVQAELAKVHGGSAGNTAALAAARADRQHAEEQARQTQQALTAADAKAKAQESHDSALATQLGASQQQLETCSAKNQQLYTVGKDILDAYVHIDFGKVLSSRQPFAAKARVRLENAAQGYGDQLYDQRYVPGAATTTAAAPAKP
jgi:Tfp pilus assembly protein FimV